MISRFMLQIANGTRSPTYLISLENSAKSFARSCPYRVADPKIFSIPFPCYMFLTYIEGKISRRINGTVSLKRRAVERVIALFPWIP
jgi:hypothetical protein